MLCYACMLEGHCILEYSLPLPVNVVEEGHCMQDDAIGGDTGTQKVNTTLHPLLCCPLCVQNGDSDPELCIAPCIAFTTQSQRRGIYLFGSQ